MGLRYGQQTEFSRQILTALYALQFLATSHRFRSLPRVDRRNVSSLVWRFVQDVCYLSSQSQRDELSLFSLGQSYDLQSTER